jgi:hypothetical protein
MELLIAQETRSAAAIPLSFQNGNGLYLDQKILAGKGENPDPGAGGQLIWRKEAEQSFPHWTRIVDVLSHDVEAQGQILMSRSTRSVNNGSCFRERMRALSVLLSRTTVSRHWRSSARNPSSMSGLVASSS